jgi:hypothetical protein
MLARSQICIRTDLYCDRLCVDLHRSDFDYFDKDGFELNQAERKYYTIMGFKLTECLNHPTLAQTWYSTTTPNLLVDHSLILYRCGYKGDAQRQLVELKKSVPQASLLLNTKPKWGFDLALDSIDQYGDIFEVVHIEYDTNIYSQFVDELNTIQERIDTIDWQHAARHIEHNRDLWQSLRGFEQNDWKARNLLNWTKAEFTEKAIRFP